MLNANIILDNGTYNFDLLYYYKVRWLLKENILIKLLTLQKVILKFYEEQQQECDLLDEEFCRNA